jgi:hypothetical protein
MQPPLHLLRPQHQTLLKHDVRPVLLSSNSIYFLLLSHLLPFLLSSFPSSASRRGKNANSSSSVPISSSPSGGGSASDNSAPGTVVHHVGAGGRPSVHTTGMFEEVTKTPHLSLPKTLFLLSIIVNPSTLSMVLPPGTGPPSSVAGGQNPGNQGTRISYPPGVYLTYPSGTGPQGATPGGILLQNQPQVISMCTSSSLFFLLFSHPFPLQVQAGGQPGTMVAAGGHDTTAVLSGTGGTLYRNIRPFPTTGQQIIQITPPGIHPNPPPGHTAVMKNVTIPIHEQRVRSPLP